MVKDYWNKQASAVLKAQMALKGVRYKALSNRLSDIGIEEKPRQLGNRIAKGAFSFAFFLKCLSALGVPDAKFPVPDARLASGPGRGSSRAGGT